MKQKLIVPITFDPIHNKHSIIYPKKPSLVVMSS